MRAERDSLEGGITERALAGRTIRKPDRESQPRPTPAEFEVKVPGTDQIDPSKSSGHTEGTAQRMKGTPPNRLDGEVNWNGA